MESIGVIEIIGTAAFSIAGAFAAKEKKLDVLVFLLLRLSPHWEVEHNETF